MATAKNILVIPTLQEGTTNHPGLLSMRTLGTDSSIQIMFQLVHRLYTSGLSIVGLLFLHLALARPSDWLTKSYLQCPKTACHQIGCAATHDVRMKEVKSANIDPPPSVKCAEVV